MVRKDARLRLLSDRIDLEMPVVGSDTALEEQARRATCLSSAYRPTRLPASARRRSRPDVRSSIPSRWSLIGCWAKFASCLADGWRKLREAQRAWDLRLTDTGFIEGETVATEYRLAENQIGWLSALAAPQG